MAQVSEEREDRVDATGAHPAAAPGTPEPGEAGTPATPDFPGEGGASATSETGRATGTPVVPETSEAGEAARLSAAGTTAAEAPAAAAQGTPADPETGASDTPAPPEAVKKASKAGRNLPAAIGVALLLGAAIIVSLLTVRYLFIGIIAIAIAVGTFEFAGVLRRVADIRVAMIPVLVGGQAMIWLAWPFGREGALTAFVLTVLACLLWRLPGGAKGYLRDISASTFAAAYLPLFGAFAAMLVPPEDGVGRVLTFLIGVVASDTGGYIAGVLGGKHPMAPTISPKKTWEGFAGSVIGGVVAGALTLSLLLDGHVWQGVIFGVAIVLTATLGDLVESLIKRDLGVKDMGTLLPGHGGIMDRLDSLLPSAVVSWLLLSAFVPV
ncbi:MULTISPECIES: phosphatidate cytidylyltransferase [unclassified Amycolatopsis]|uniref:phosphatidate cytidylyltransferase n=1 Tax=unclassified Amycolatopsis TaxID=2618356 RepID=UPI002874D522|nr:MULTISPECIES: phosphatidate cytidylyltransferase [unclassified Amycolatopsis]MDS0137934.1 CDP-archaeol synthase [Amycolatopsis sp. 505]MDS0144153.1 CDP-archaeol synthase [Amycolatopsis sp. CM201R]